MSEAPDGAPEGVTEDTSLAESEALIHGAPTEAVEDEDPADDAGAETPPAKPKKSFQERIDEKTRLQKEAEREAEYWKAKALQNTQPQTTPATAPAPQQDGEPDPNAYEFGETDARFIRDLARYETRQELAQQDARNRQLTARQTFNDRVASQYPDGEPAGLIAFRRLETVPVAVNEIMVLSENSPRLADYLGSHPAELAELSNLSTAAATYKLAAIEARLTAAPSARKTATDAPPATPQVRGAGGQFKPPPDTNDFTAFRKTYGGSA